MTKSENKVLGIVGALVGIALALVLWALIGAQGSISWIGGLALAAGAFGGYRLLGHELGKIGIIVCAVLLIISVYAGTRLAYASYIHKECQDDKNFAFTIEFLGFDSDASVAEIYADFDDYVGAVDEAIEMINELSSEKEETMTEEFNRNLLIGYIATIAASIFIVIRLRQM